MISRQHARNCAILLILPIYFFANPAASKAQSSAPGLLQPAYMPDVQPRIPLTHPVKSQPRYYPPPLLASPGPHYYSDAQRMANSRVPKRHDLMATNQHSLLEYRKIYRNGTTPHPHELVGQWNGVNKGIVQIAGYGQFVKDLQVNPQGQLVGDNIQVGQVKPSQARLDGWQANYDLPTKDYERRGSFLVQQPTGRGFFGRGAFFSYANGNNPEGDPARVLVDEVVKVDGNHMIGRAVAKWGPFKIPLAYFVLERR